MLLISSQLSFCVVQFQSTICSAVFNNQNFAYTKKKICIHVSPTLKKKPCAGHIFAPAVQSCNCAKKNVICALRTVLDCFSATVTASEALLWTALNCTALHGTAQHSTVLQCTALHYTALHCTYCSPVDSTVQWTQTSRKLTITLDRRHTYPPL